MEYQERLIRQSNYWYNDGLKKARVRELSGAIVSLRKSLQYCAANVDARNLLGLVYYGRGEVAEALVEWIISKNYKAQENIAEYYIRKVEDTSGELDIINTAVKRYNQSLTFCRQGSEDMAIIQLKKAVAAHPSFVKAFQLLGLLYLKSGQPQKARAVLRKAYKLDVTDSKTLRYLRELKFYSNAKAAGPNEEKEKTVIYRTGNETIIQPAASVVKDMPVSVTFMNLFIGILIGAAMVWFLIVPAVNAMKSSGVTRTAAAYSQEIAVQKAQVSALKKKIDDYRLANEESEAAQATAASATESYEKLMTAAEQYASGERTYAEIAEILKDINPDVLGEVGQARYTTLVEKIYPSVCQNIYAEAKNAYEAQNWQEAARALERLLEMDEQYEDGEAILALADTYLAAGEIDKSKGKYNRVIELYPDSVLETTARSGLKGIPAGIFGLPEDSGNNDEE